MIPTDSDKPSAYKWSDTKGQDGTPGLPGEDGRTPYFHIKYSDNGECRSLQTMVKSRATT